METFLFALRAVTPLLLTIALGAAVRRLASWEGSFYKKVNALCFHLFLPINLFCNIYVVESLSDVNWMMVGFLVVSIFLTVAMGWLVSALAVRRRDQKGVMIQATFRSNQAILGLPLAESIGGPAAVAFASVTTSVCIPVYNALAVLTLSYYSGSQRPKWSSIFKEMAKNPLILGSLLGLICVLLRPLVGGEPLLEKVPGVYTALLNLSKIASPLMLFALGAGLDFKTTKHLLPLLSLGVFMRLVFCPALVLGIALALREPLRLTALEIPTILAICATPVAVASSVMTQELGGDEQLAGQLVVWSSVLSMGTLFLAVYALRAFGAL